MHASSWHCSVFAVLQSFWHSKRIFAASYTHWSVSNWQLFRQLLSDPRHSHVSQENGEEQGLHFQSWQEERLSKQASMLSVCTVLQLSLQGSPSAAAQLRRTAKAATTMAFLRMAENGPGIQEFLEWVLRRAEPYHHRFGHASDRRRGGGRSRENCHLEKILDAPAVWRERCLYLILSDCAFAICNEINSQSFH